MLCVILGGVVSLVLAFVLVSDYEVRMWSGSAGYVYWTKVQGRLDMYSGNAVYDFNQKLPVVSLPRTD